MKYFLVLLLLPLFSQCSNLLDSSRQASPESPSQRKSQRLHENSISIQKEMDHTKIIKEGEEDALVWRDYDVYGKQFATWKTLDRKYFRYSFSKPSSDWWLLGKIFKGNSCL